VGEEGSDAENGARKFKRGTKQWASSRRCSSSDVVINVWQRHKPRSRLRQVPAANGRGVGTAGHCALVFLHGARPRVSAHTARSGCLLTSSTLAGADPRSGLTISTVSGLSQPGECPQEL
jgi:hypothetical protein